MESQPVVDLTVESNVPGALSSPSGRQVQPPSNHQANSNTPQFAFSGSSLFPNHNILSGLQFLPGGGFTVMPSASAASNPFHRAVMHAYSSAVALQPSAMLSASSRNMPVYGSAPTVRIAAPPQTRPIPPQPVSLQRSSSAGSIPQQTHVGEYLKVTFTLINIQHFTARAEIGSVTLDLLDALRKTDGAKFDWAKRRWYFPLSSHDALQVALTRRRCFVEGIPREILIAAQLSQRKASSQQIVVDLDAPSPGVTESNELAAILPVKVIDCLANFQQEAVKFVTSKDGRALVADEMGLGKTRSAIGSVCAYRDEWPVLVVCPSSARHHWQAELRALLVPEVLAAQQILLLESTASCILHRDSIRRSLRRTNERLGCPVPSANPARSESTEDLEGLLKYLDDGEDTEAIKQPVLRGGCLAAAGSSASDGSSPASDQDVKFVIVSYALLCKMWECLGDSSSCSAPFQVIVVDESHYMKSKQAQRTKVLLPMLHKARRAILLSGTPALSRPMELFTQLHALNPEQWSEYKSFGKRYCLDKQKTKPSSTLAPTKAGWGVNMFKGANNLQELHVLLTATLMIRRLKANILSQLPSKKRYICSCEVADPELRDKLRDMVARIKELQQSLDKRRKARRPKKRRKTKYSEEDGDGDEDEEDAEDGQSTGGPELDAELKDTTTQEVKAHEKSLLMQLFNQSGAAKLPSVLAQIDTFLESDHAGKLLVFAHHLDVLQSVSKHLTAHKVEHIYIDGSTSSQERHNRTLAFQSDGRVRVAVLGITAAGIALTLTAASTVYFAELYWTPASLLQAEDRAHRMGQLRDVSINYFLAQGTVDDLLWPLIRKKMQVLGEMVEGQLDIDMAASLHKRARPPTTSAQAEEGAAPTVKGEGKPVGEEKEYSSQDQDQGQAEAEGEAEEDELSELAQELAREESKKKPRDEDAEGPPAKDEGAGGSAGAGASVWTEKDEDEDGSVEENEYETHLRREQPVDMLARAYIKAYRIYIKQQEMRAKMKQEQALAQQAQSQTQQPAVIDLAGEARCPAALTHVPASVSAPTPLATSVQASASTPDSALAPAPAATVADPAAAAAVEVTACPAVVSTAPPAACSATQRMVIDLVSDEDH